MRAIDRTLVDGVWRDMTGYAPARIASEAQAFLERQPHAAAFSRLVTSAFDPAVQKAGLGLVFLLFKVLEASLGRPFPLLAEERVMAAYAETQAWLGEHDGAAPAQLLETLDHGEHPSLPAYILSVFYDEGLTAGDYDETVRASLFCLLKTLTDALDLGRVGEASRPTGSGLEIQHSPSPNYRSSQRESAPNVGFQDLTPRSKVRRVRLGLT